tara:strand:- start:2571 stop:2813 length:243 start_codon:yes stop_codon:yes gene_type:complete
MKMPTMQIMLPDEVTRLQEHAQYLYGFDKRMSWMSTLEMWKTAFTKSELIVLWQNMDVMQHPYDDEVYDTLYHFYDYFTD